MKTPALLSRGDEKVGAGATGLRKMGYTAGVLANSIFHHANRQPQALVLETLHKSLMR